MKNSIIQYVCMILLSCALLFGMYTSTTLEQYKVKIPVTVSSCDRSPVYFQIFLEVQAKYSMISKTAEVLWCLNNTEFFLYQNPAEDMLPYKDDFQEFNRRVCALKIPTLYTWEKRILSTRDKVGLDILKIMKLLPNADLDDEALECAMKEML